MAMNKTDVRLVADAIRKLKPSKKTHPKEYVKWLRVRNDLIVGLVPAKYVDDFKIECPE